MKTLSKNTLAQGAATFLSSGEAKPRQKSFSQRANGATTSRPAAGKPPLPAQAFLGTFFGHLYEQRWLATSVHSMTGHAIAIFYGMQRQVGSSKAVTSHRTPYHAIVLFLLLALLPLAARAETLALPNNTRLTYTTPAPILDNEPALPAPQFDADGNATLSGLTLRRTITALPNSTGYAIRLSVTNTRATPIHLRALVPLQITGQQNLLVANQAVANWTVFRLARHKNDIPGPFRPVNDSEATRDAATDNSKGIKETDDPVEAAKRGISFHADPALVIIPDNNADAAVFIGFDGQTEHLSDIALTLDSKRAALHSLDTTAEFDGVLVPPGATRETHTLYIQTGKNCDALLADHVARIKTRYGARLSPLKNIFCTWYFYGPEITAADIRADLAELKKRPVAFDTFLIDYNWDDLFGDWNTDTARFPEGMAAMAAEIRAAGLTPGLWSCPFFLDPACDALKKYPDLPLKNANGEPIKGKIMPFMEPCYILDPTAPSAEKFLIELCGKFRAWGYDYLKFDFLRVVLLDENARFHDRTATRAQAFKRGIDIIRRASGDDAIIGVWGALYEACAGFANIMRSGSDVRGHWDPLEPNAPATRYRLRMRQTFARVFYDQGGLWTSDQDALQLRRRAFENKWRSTRNHISMGNFTDEEAFSLVVYRFLGGGVIQVSEKLDELDQDRYDLYKMVIPTYAPVAKPFKEWTDYVPEYFVSHFGRAKPQAEPVYSAAHTEGSSYPWAVVTLANWNGAESKTLSFSPSDIPDLPTAESYAAFEFKAQTFLGVYKADESISQNLPAHAAGVIRLTPLQNTTTPQLIGTDLNLSNGQEIETINRAAVTLRPEVRMHPATFTFLTYINGKVTITKTKTK